MSASTAGRLVGTGLLLAGLAGLAALAWPWHSPGAATPAAAVEKPKSELDLARTTLTDTQRTSLGVRTAPVKLVAVQQSLKLHGFIIAKPGSEVVVSAPVGGYVRLADKGHVPVPGGTVKGGQVLFTVEPVLAPVERAQFNNTMVQLLTLRRTFEGELAKARESEKAAKAEHTRTEGLVKSKLRGQQDLEQATAKLRYAEADLSAARDKLKLFDGKVGTLEKDLSQPMPLKAPRGGCVLSVAVSPGQFVTAGTILVTLADLDAPWLRVAVNEQDLQRIQPKQAAAVVLPGRRAPLVARSAGLVPLVDPIKHTADLLYDLSGAAGGK